MEDMGWSPTDNEEWVDSDDSHLIHELDPSKTR